MFSRKERFYLKDLEELQEFIKNLTFEGIPRKLDELGRVVIPIDYRNGKYEDGTVVYIQVMDDYLIVTDNDDFKMGIAKKFDELGRIQITKEMREELNWEFRDSLMVWAFDGGLILKKVEEKCIFCRTKEQIEEFKDKFICDNCKEELSETKKDV